MQLSLVALYNSCGYVCTDSCYKWGTGVIMESAISRVLQYPVSLQGLI